MPSGIAIQRITVTGTQTVTVLPGLRYRITMQAGAAAIVLDDSGSSQEFAQEFSYVIAATATGMPSITTSYLSGAPVRMPAGFAFETEKTYEINVLDSLAIAMEWGDA